MEVVLALIFENPEWAAILDFDFKIISGLNSIEPPRRNTLDLRPLDHWKISARKEDPLIPKFHTHRLAE